jgi:uncharacterized protein (TIGR02594 family)
MPTLLEVMESRLGIQEVPGANDNPIIVEWFEAIGHAEVKDDETSWCATCLGSACIEAGLPVPATNVNMMARSYLTWGVKVELNSIEPGDVAVWPRGDPKGWQGHVNVVSEVRHSDGGSVEVRCIGGNQGGMRGGDAVTLTGWQDAGKALGFRRPIEATVPALRPHSSEIKTADKVEVSSWLALLGSSALAAVKELLAPVQVPQFADLPAALSWWQMVISGGQAIWRVALDNPWLAGSLITCVVCILVARVWRSKRVEKHAAGVPISSQVEVPA